MATDRSLRIAFVVLVVCCLVQNIESARRNSRRRAQSGVVQQPPLTESCPLPYDGTCYKIFRFDGSAFTRAHHSRFCQELEIGRNGHLADIKDKANFDAVAGYVGIYDEAQRTRGVEPSILLGMTYDTESRTITFSDNTKVESIYWGERARPLAWGSNMVMRVSARSRSTKLQNMGGPGYRYGRIMCQYTPK